MVLKRPKKRTRVVIVGANFAGLSAAKSLPRSFEVAVLDSWPHFEFLPNIHELVSLIKKPAQLRLSRNKIVGAAGHRFVNKRAVIWRPKYNRIQTGSGLVLEYDYAICATGGESNFFGVPGAQDIAHNFKRVDDCHSIGKALQGLVKSRGNASVAIVGGGIEGVEALGEILRRYGKHPGMKITLVDGQKEVLSFGKPALHEEVAALCQNYPVRFCMETRVVAITHDSVELSGGETIPADLVIWTGGVSPGQGLFEWGLAEKPNQWAPVRPTLQSRLFDNVFVVGDSAGMAPPLGKQAYHAMDMGKLAARNIIRLSKGKALRDFKPSPKPTLVAFGNLSTFMVSDSLTLASPTLAYAKELVYQSVMAQLDPGWAPGRTARLGVRLARGVTPKALPTMLSPKDLIRHGGAKIL